MNPIHIISLGAGVQSSTMALMAAKGEITPMPTAAIFADTQDEPESVYKWLDWLEKQLPFPVYRVTNGSLSKKALEMRTTKDGRSFTVTSIPYHTLSDGEETTCVNCNTRTTKRTDGLVCDECGSGKFVTRKINRIGMIPHRTCTADFKIKPLLKKARQLGQIKRGQKSVGVIQWIGISLDEISRMKPSREKWAESIWPLVEKRMTRHDCLLWMQRNGFPKPPRSACVFCPFHSDAEWKNLKENDPVAFERAVAKSKGLTSNFHSKIFLHKSCRPLSDVDFSTEEERGQINMFNNECEGMCGV